jgi:hypothetical protein
MSQSFEAHKAVHEIFRTLAADIGTAAPHPTVTASLTLKSVMTRSSASLSPTPKRRKGARHFPKQSLVLRSWRRSRGVWKTFCGMGTSSFARPSSAARRQRRNYGRGNSHQRLRKRAACCSSRRSVRPIRRSAHFGPGVAWRCANALELKPADYGRRALRAR